MSIINERDYYVLLEFLSSASILTRAQWGNEDGLSMIFQVSLSLSDYVLTSRRWHAEGKKEGRMKTGSDRIDDCFGGPSQAERDKTES